MNIFFGSSDYKKLLSDREAAKRHEELGERLFGGVEINPVQFHNRETATEARIRPDAHIPTTAVPHYEYPHVRQERPSQFTAILEYYGFEKKMAIPSPISTLTIAVMDPVTSTMVSNLNVNSPTSVTPTSIRRTTGRRLTFHLDRISHSNTVYYRFDREDRI